MQVKNCECKYNITSISEKISIKQIDIVQIPINYLLLQHNLNLLYIYINRYIPLEIIFDGNTFCLQPISTVIQL